MELSRSVTYLDVGATGLEPVTPLLVRNRRGLEYLGFARPTSVFMGFGYWLVPQRCP